MRLMGDGRNNLTIERQGHQPRPAQTRHEAIIVTAPPAQTVPVRIKGPPGNEDQIK